MPQPGSQKPYPMSFNAGEDLSNFMNRFGRVKLDGAVPRVFYSRASEEVDGVIRYDADDEKAVTLDIFGVVILESGAAVAVGDEVIPDATGRAITGRFDLYRGAGRAMQAATGAGQFIEVFLYGPGRSGTVDSGVEELTGDAAVISVLKRTSLLTSNGAWTASLAAGRFVGQRKTIRLMVDTSGQYTITGLFREDATNYTNIVLDTADDMVELEWNGTRWTVVSHILAAFS